VFKVKSRGPGTGCGLKTPATQSGTSAVDQGRAKSWPGRS